MKIIAVGRNYVDHIAELKNEKPEEPVVFLKPDTALLQNNAPFYYPPFTKDLHYETEIVVKIGKEGKFIQPQFAAGYVTQIGIGIDFTARDLQAKLKAKGLPWEISKAFNGSAPVSAFKSVSDFPDLQNINFSLLVNGEQKQASNTSLMLFPIDAIISYVSQFFTLKTGDLIFTGTPSGVGPVSIGDRLQACIENEVWLDFEIK